MLICPKKVIVSGLNRCGYWLLHDKKNTVDFSGMLIKNNHMQPKKSSMKISGYFESKGGDVCVLTRSKKGQQVCLKILKN